MARKLIVFDVSGVLLKEKMGGFKDILTILGKGKVVQRLDERYQREKQKRPWGLEELSKLTQGFSEKELKRVAFNYCKQNLTRGAKKILNSLKKRGHTIGALTSNPQFIIEPLTKILPLDFIDGTRLEFKNGVATGKIKKKVDRYGKAKILREIIKNYGAKKEDVIVVGHSITDLPMAELAGNFIAFCPRENIVKEKANKIIGSFQRLRDELSNEL